MRRALTATLAAALLLAACTGDPAPDASPMPTEAPTASPSPTDAPTPTATPSDQGTAAAEVDVTTTPEVITEEWVEAVINTLLAEYGEIAAEVLALPVLGSPDMLPPDIIPRVEALFDGQYEQRRIAEIARLATDEDFVRSKVLPATEYLGARMTVELLQVGTDSCIVVVGRSDFSGSEPNGGLSDQLSAWSLSPATSSSGSPTQWVLIDQLLNSSPDGTPNPDTVMLNATLADYGDSLESSCS